MQIGKILRTSFTTLLLYKNVVKQQQFIRKHIIPELAPYRNAKDKSLSDKDFKKITSYYGFGVPAVLGEAICCLRGKSMSNQERMASTSQGAYTGLFDDFFDEWGLPEERLKRLVNEPELYNAENANQALFLMYYIRSLELARNPEHIKASLMDVLNAQVDSLKQAGEERLSKEEITTITKQKGGHSLLFYRHVFDHELDENERDCLFMLGATLQLVNDCFDVYKDREAGVQTLVTTSTHISEVRRQYEEWLAAFFLLAKELSFPKSQKKKLMRMISLGVRRADVCLNQLEALESTTDHTFQLAKYSRKELIVDMDTAPNILRSVWFHMTKKI